MKLPNSLLVHSGVFVIAGALGLRAFTRGEEPNANDATVEIWGGTEAKVERIEFEDKKRKLTLEAANDATGRYFLGTLVRAKETKGKGASDPHGHAAPDTQDLADPAAEKETLRFVGVTATQALSAGLAPMKALRFLGKLDQARLPEFGFDQDRGTVRVTIGGKTHQLVLGGAAPGGSDDYVQNPETGEGYVVMGSVTKALLQADTSLIERELHAFAAEDVERVRVVQREQSRELVRHAQQKGFWSNPTTPDAKDETASNWMSKVERLRVTTYVPEPEPPVKPEDTLLKVEYLGRQGKSLGYLEFVKRAPAEGSEQPEYLAKTEHTRWYTQILRSNGEQIEQDIGSVLAQ